MGIRKQSVEDAERLFSPSLLKFKDYQYEARYIRVILGWRQACDERGLSELERCQHNYRLLNFLLEDGIISSMTLLFLRSIGMPLQIHVHVCIICL